MSIATFTPVRKVPDTPGKYYNSEGYVLVWVSRGRFELEHRVIVEAILGRKLRHNETVHHIDGVRSHNTNTNLLVSESWYHHLLHVRCQRRYGRWHLPGVRDPERESLRRLHKAPRLNSENATLSMYPPWEGSDTVTSKSTGSWPESREPSDLLTILRNGGTVRVIRGD